MKAPAPKKSARQIAADVLKDFDPATHFTTEALQKRLHATEERQRATDLLCGTVRNLETIDAVITEFSSREVHRISPNILSIIRIAAHELLYRPQSPPYSILNEAVEYTRKIAGRKQTGFVNAVLRQIQRHIANRSADLTAIDPRTTLPHNCATGCQFDEQILPSPQTDPVDYLSIAFSLPQWLVKEWLADFDFDTTRQICLASNRNPGLYIRPNTLQTTTAQLAEMITAAEVECSVTPDADAILLLSPRSIVALPGFSEGLFYVQDLAASHAVKALDPQPGWTILDPCAAPGTKTIQIAQATNDRARILATDINPKRLELLANNIKRLALSSIEIIGHEELRNPADQPGPFDAILLDVPCSNTGVLAKRAEVRHRITPQAVQSLTRTQTSLLRTYAPMLKPTGKLCYSTCSIQPAETTRIIQSFLEDNPQFQLLTEELILPKTDQFDHDGAYLAVIAKS